METSPLATLRPLHLGELLDRAIRLYRANFLTFVGIIALVYVPLMILQSASSVLMSSSIVGDFSTPDQIFTNAAYWIGLLSTGILSLAQFVLVQGVAMGALTRAVADNYLGRKTGIVDAYRGIGKSWMSLLGALLFIILLVVVVGIWWLVPCIGWFTGLGMLAFLGFVINPLVPAVVVLENQGAVAAVRRAWNLARRRFWPVVGYVFILSLFSLLVVNGPSAVANLILLQVFQSFSNSGTDLILTAVLQSLVGLVFLLIYYPLQMTAFTLIYLDLRVRTEGLDLALLTMEAAGSVDVAEAMAVPSPATDERLITGPDLGNFAILTLIGVGLYILFFSFLMGGIFFLSSLFN